MYRYLKRDITSAEHALRATPACRIAAGLMAILLAACTAVALAAELPALPKPIDRTATDVPAYAIPVATVAEALRSGRIPREVVEEATRTGSVFVIIKLAIPGGWRPEHLLSSAQVEQQQQAIRAVQQRILDKLAGARIDDVKRYRYVPHLGMQVPELVLAELVQMPEVYVIGVDRRFAPALAKSTARIGAGNVANAYDSNSGFWKYIAILDSGVDRHHPFFDNRVVSEGCYSTDSGSTDSFCPNGVEATTRLDSGLPCNITKCDHGTHVAGIAAGGAPGFTFSGVAPGARLIAMQVFHRENSAMACSGNPPCIRGFTSDVLLALERVYELRNTFSIAAANMSLGAGRFEGKCDRVEPALLDSFTLLRGAKIAPVVASGNDGQTWSGGVATFAQGLASPACVSAAISVGRVDNKDAIAASSQADTFLSLLAPGTAINSSVPGGGFEKKSGTSMAAPHVAGAFAVLKALDPNRSVDELLMRLQNTGVPVTDTRLTPQLITSRIQLDAAVENQTGRPLRPGNLVINNLSGSKVWAKWQDNSRSETVFRLSATPTDSTLPTRHGTALANAVDGSVGSLKPNRDYELALRACNAANLCSEAITQRFTTVNTTPCVPTDFRAGTVTTSSIQILWNSNCLHPVTSFRLRSNVSGSWQPITLGGNDRSRTFPNLSPDSAYSFVIQACNPDDCSADSPILTITTQSAGSPPAAPSHLRLCGSQFLESCPGGGITLLWRDNSNNEDRFEIEWATAQAGVPPFSNGSYHSESLGPNVTGKTFASLQSGLIHYFRVRACNVAGCSAYSNMSQYTSP